MSPLKSVRGFETRIHLQFILNPDNSYGVYSYTYSNRKKPIVCKVHYEKISADSIYLEEFEDTTDPANKSFQKIYLKIEQRAKITLLTGKWKYAGSSSWSGDIEFRRRKNKD